MTNKRSKMVKVIVVLAASALAAAVYVAIVVGPPTVAGLQARDSRHRLLVGAEHKALLEACRVLSKQAITGELSPGHLPGEVPTTLRGIGIPRVDHFPATSVCELLPRMG